MFSLLLLFSFFAVGLSDEFASSVVGGVISKDARFLGMVSLSKNGYHYCGGAIISPRHIVTARHCVDNVKKFDVTGGDFRISKHNFKRKPAKLHFFGKDDDIALVKLNKKVPDNLPIMSLTDGQEDETGEMCVAAGWGHLKFGNTKGVDELRQVDVPIYDKSECSKSYSYVKNSDICLGYKRGGKDTCQGDSGSPAVNKQSFNIVGIVSSGKGCALAKFPGVYKKISFYKSRILRIINKTRKRKRKRKHI